MLRYITFFSAYIVEKKKKTYQYVSLSKFYLTELKL